MSQDQTQQDKVFSAEQAETDVTQALNTTDGLRADELNKLTTFKRHKVRLQDRELARLERKYGSNHPRVQQVANAQEQEVAELTSMRMENNRQSQVIEEQDATSWIVHGHVYDCEGLPVAKANIEVMGTNNEPVPRMPSTTTNKNGYYKIVFTRDTAAQPLPTDDTSDNPDVSYGTDTDGNPIPGTADTNADSTDTTSDAAGLRGNTTSNLSGIRINTNAGSNAANAPKDDRIYMRRLSSGLRLNNAQMAKSLVFVRATMPHDDTLCADSTFLEPKVGESNYRDLIINAKQSDILRTGVDDRRATRYLGNSNTRELHDLDNEKGPCQIDEIRADRCVNFNSIEPALELGYDYCAYCFGKHMSRR